MMMAAGAPALASRRVPCVTPHTGSARLRSGARDAQRRARLAATRLRAHDESSREAAEIEPLAPAETPEPFREEATLRDGQKVLFRRMDRADTEPVTDLLAESFSTAIGAKQYQKFLRFKISSYVAEMLASPPQVSACLVCTLQSADGDGAPALAGTCEVSLVPPQSSKYVQALRVPNDGESCYMSNMTVAPAFRRRGVGTALLSAMESFALTWRPMGCDVYLHVRLMDEPAVALYTKHGYQVVATDHFAFLRGERRTSLMKKRLPARAGATAAKDALPQAATTTAPL